MKSEGAYHARRALGYISFQTTFPRDAPQYLFGNIFITPYIYIYIYIYITAVAVKKQGDTHISMHYDELNKKEFNGILI